MKRFPMVALLALLTGACTGGNGHTDDTPCDNARGECPDTDTGVNPGPTGILAINLPSVDPEATVGIGADPVDPSTSTGEGMYSVTYPVGKCHVWVESDTFTYREQFPIVLEDTTTHVEWIEFGDYGYTFDEVEFCDKDNDTRVVYTGEFEDRGVTIRGLPVDALPMLGYEFERDMGGGNVVRGTVSDTMIHIETWLDDQKTYEEDMTVGACE